jgi:hypothetical protein
MFCIDHMLTPEFCGSEIQKDYFPFLWMEEQEKVWAFRQAQV